MYAPPSVGTNFWVGVGVALVVGLFAGLAANLLLPSVRSKISSTTPRRRKAAHRTNEKLAERAMELAEERAALLEYLLVNVWVLTTSFFILLGLEVLVLFPAAVTRDHHATLAHVLFAIATGLAAGFAGFGLGFSRSLLQTITDVRVARHAAPTDTE